MQVYRRILAPYMPNGTADKTNAPSPYYAPGELGCAFEEQNTGAEYLRVQLDSGACSLTAIGAVAAGQLAFWKDQARAIVTNDKNQCDVGPSGAINRVAGVFMCAATAAPGQTGSDGLPLMYMTDVMIRGTMNVVASAALAGAQATVDTTANTSQVLYTTGVNTAPVSQVVGIFKGALSNGKASVNVAVGFAE